MTSSPASRASRRAPAYAALLSDPYPPFGGSDEPGYPVRMGFAGPLEHYSRSEDLLPFILAIPILVVRYAMNILLEIGAVGAWFVILFTGKMPRGLFDLMVLANSYTARSDAYLFLLTETYPPFQDEQTRAAGTPRRSESWRPARRASRRCAWPATRAAWRPPGRSAARARRAAPRARSRRR